MKLSRRKFLKVGGIGATSACLLGSLGSFKIAHSKSPTYMGKKKEYIASNCGMCVNKCGIIAEVIDGRLHKINPNPKHIKSRGMLCAKGNAGATIPYSPERLKRPLLRVGQRGEGKWKEISWDEAFKIFAENLAKIKEKYKNRSAVAFASTEGLQEEFFYYIVNAYGSLNTVRHPTLCLSTNIQGWSSVFGVYPDADLMNAEYIIMLGSDRAASFITPDSVDFIKNRPKGQKLIYLDPRFTPTAAKADKWYPIKPRTDSAFILALMHVIIKEDLYDKEFVEKYTVGFEELKEYVKDKTPEWAEEKTEIPAKDIYEIAREFAKHAPRSVVYPGRRSSFYVNEVYFRRACACLVAICGCWDVEGGVVPKSSIKLNTHVPTFPFFELAEQRVDKSAAASIKKVVPDSVMCPLVGTGLPEDSCSFLSEKDGSWIAFREAILNDEPYPVRGFVCFKQNPMQSVPNQKKTLDMLKKMEFICVIDIQMSDTAWFADLVLPHTTYLESWDPAHNIGGIWPIVVFRQPVIKPLFDAKPMFEIAKGVIHEMLKIPSLWDDTDKEGLEEFKRSVVQEVLDKPIEEYIKKQLSIYPGAFERIKKEGCFYLTDKGQYGKTRKPGFRFKTATGKIELYSERYAKMGLDPLPIYCEGNMPKEGQYRFIVGRVAWHTHSSTQNIPYLWEIQKENYVWINTDEAKKLGIKEGDYVIIKSNAGEQKVRAHVTDKIRQDCVYYENGYNRLSPQMSLVYKKGASEAVVLEDYLDTISGSVAMHETMVTIEKVK